MSSSAKVIDTTPLLQKVSNEGKSAKTFDSPWHHVITSSPIFLQLTSFLGLDDLIFKLGLKRAFLQILTFPVVFSTAFMMWKILSLLVCNESPVVVVLSESMYPAFSRGDFLFIWLEHGPTKIKANDITVFRLKGKAIPIVHRAHKIHQRLDDGGKFHAHILTKGDNNDAHDRGLYNDNQLWLHPEDILGKVVGYFEQSIVLLFCRYLPYGGIFVIWLNDYKWLKFVFVALLGYSVLINREEAVF